MAYPPKLSFSVEAEPGLRRLTSELGNNTGAVWSPDGKRIAYVSDRFGNWTLHIINVESGKDIQLTKPNSISGYPDWSPEGDRIAFWSYRKNQSQICAIDLGGTNERQLTTTPLLKSEPRWSPDGKMILFSQRDEYWQICAVEVETKRQWQVSTGENHHWAPLWMPNGKEILYYSSDGFVLKTIDVDGRNQRNLTFASVAGAPADLRPRVSPDHKKILFNSLRSPNYGVWLMDSDGKNLQRLTWHGAGDRTPSWSIDGKKILYCSYRSGNAEIWVMESDGSNQTQLTKNPFDDLSPSWSPDGGRIAFESNRGGKFDIWLLELNTPLEATVSFQKYAYQNSSSEAKLTFRGTVKDKLRINAVSLHFDWQPLGIYDRFNFTPPVLLSSPSVTGNQTILFKVPSEVTSGYHFYDLKVEFRLMVDGSHESLKTYQHTAKDLAVASQERAIYETLHERVALEVETQNRRTQREGNELLVKANQELLTAEKLALDGRLNEAVEHLRLSESLLRQPPPEEKATQFLITGGAATAIVLVIALATIAVRRRMRGNLG